MAAIDPKKTEIIQRYIPIFLAHVYAIQRSRLLIYIYLFIQAYDHSSSFYIFAGIFNG